MKLSLHQVSHKAVIFSGLLTLVVGLVSPLANALDTTSPKNVSKSAKSKQPTSHDDKMDMNDDHQSMMKKNSKAYKQMQKLKDEDVKRGPKEGSDPTDDMSGGGINDM